jgi:predicted RNase H-like nuclease (RuvC/YqgF family)
VTPDMSIVPKKYHTFISPPLRRVFLDAREDNRDSCAVIENLNEDIAVLRERVTSLKRDKDLLMNRCESAQSVVARLSADERNTRVANRKARVDALEDKQEINRLRAEIDYLKSQ